MLKADSWFRGALLSALFFALLIGGAPSMVAAEYPLEEPTLVTASHVSPQRCREAGDRWVGPANPNGKGGWRRNNPGNPSGYCKSAQDYCKEVESMLPGLGIATGAGFGLNPWLGWGMLAISAFEVWDYYSYDCWKY